MRAWSRSTRLPAAERRQAIVEAALRVFAGGSYSGATTAEIARAAGVSEPILYRHFASKRELYLACLDAAWVRAPAAFDEQLAELGDRDARERDRAGRARLPRLGRGEAVDPLDPGAERGRRGRTRDPRQASCAAPRLREVHDFVGEARSAAGPGGGRRSPAGSATRDAEAWLVRRAERCCARLRRTGSAAPARHRTTSPAIADPAAALELTGRVARQRVLRRADPLRGSRTARKRGSSPAAAPGTIR